MSKIIEPHPPLDSRPPDSSVALAFLKQELEKQRDQNTPKDYITECDEYISELEAYLKMPRPLEVKMAHQKHGRR